MIIDDAQYPIVTAWEGALTPPIGQFAMKGGGDLPRVSIGQPVWWDDAKALGENWVQPSGNRRYGLARFSFTLHPADRQSMDSVEFNVSLHSVGSEQRPIAFDLIPGLTTEEQTGTRTFGIDPKMKFANIVEVSGIQASTTINVKQALVVTSVYGVGESAVRWAFKSRPAHPLLGSQSVYLIIAWPTSAQHVRAQILLSAQVESTRWGKLRGQLPEEEQAHFIWVLQ